MLPMSLWRSPEFSKYPWLCPASLLRALGAPAAVSHHIGAHLNMSTSGFADILDSESLCVPQALGLLYRAPDLSLCSGAASHQDSEQLGLAGGPSGAQCSCCSCFRCRFGKGGSGRCPRAGGGRDCGSSLVRSPSIVASRRECCCRATSLAIARMLA